MYSKFIYGSMLLLLTSSIQAAPNARDIMKKVENRDDGKSQYSISVVATCRYTRKGKSIRCSEKPRIKVLEGVSKDFGKNGKDSRSVSVIKKPAAEAGIGFLQYDYDDPSKDTDQWMYLSAMGKVKRLISGNDDEPKSGTLFGSELSYEDVERPHIDDYTYKLIKEEVWQGRPCWVIESRPTPKRARKSNYSKSTQWIDKERLLSLQSQVYDRTGRPIKLIVVSDVVKVDGIWVGKKININNLQTRRVSTMKTEKLIINPKVDNALFKVRTLTDGAYREEKLNSLRAKLK